MISVYFEGESDGCTVALVMMLEDAVVVERKREFEGCQASTVRLPIPIKHGNTWQDIQRSVDKISVVSYLPAPGLSIQSIRGEVVCVKDHVQVGNHFLISFLLGLKIDFVKDKVYFLNKPIISL